MAAYSYVSRTDGSRLVLAYTWGRTRLPTPRWFDDNDGDLIARHPRLGRALFRVFARLRSMGVVQLHTVHHR